MVVDETDVGVAGFDVVAYRKTQKLPQRAAQATTDDRGIDCCTGPGPGHICSEHGWHCRREWRVSAHVLQRNGELDSGANGGIRSPIRTQDEWMSVPCRGNSSVWRSALTPRSLTLRSQSRCPRSWAVRPCKGSGFVFTGLVAGEYEVSAQQGDSQGAVQRVSLARDAQITLVLPQPPIQIVVSGGDSGELRVRRKDLPEVQDRRFWCRSWAVAPYSHAAIGS